MSKFQNAFEAIEIVLFRHAGRKTVLMSAKDFYNSITPGSTLTHGTGTGVYTRVEEHEIGSQKLYEQEHVPVRDSILNKVWRNQGIKRDLLLP